MHGKHSRQRVAQRDVHSRRCFAGVAVDVPDAAHCLRDRSETRTTRIRPGLPVTRDSREDDSRVHRGHLLVPDVPTLEGARPEVLRHDVRLLGEAQEQLLPAFLAEVQRHALLVPRLHRPPERAPLVARLTPVADRVGLTRCFDLDDLGSHVTEQPTGEGPGKQGSELDHPDSRQRPDPQALRRRSRLEILGRSCHCRPPPMDASASMCWASTSRAS